MLHAKALAIADFDVRNEKAAAPDAFRDVMRELASGVALVTCGADRNRAGCAVTSFVSLSLSPASMLVCLNAESSTLRALRASGFFVINILASHHEHLARRFSAAKLRGAERFAEGDWVAGETGAPALRDALAFVECRLERIVDHATHAILIGAAVAVGKGPSAPALLHWRSRFETLS